MGHAKPCKGEFCETGELTSEGPICHQMKTASDSKKSRGKKKEGPEEGKSRETVGAGKKYPYQNFIAGQHTGKKQRSSFLGEERAGGGNVRAVWCGKQRAVDH